MPIVNNKSNFLKELKKYVGEKIEYNFSSYIKIEELQKEGKGEIYLDISSYTLDDKFFFVKIEHLPNHNIGVSNHCDGIVLKVDLKNKKIEVLIFEMKLTARFKEDSLEKAHKQLQNAYYFINYLQFDKCFNLNYKFFIAYKNDNTLKDSDVLKTIRGYYQEFYTSWIENKSKIPLMLPLCKFDYFDFEKVEFGDKFAI